VEQQMIISLLHDGYLNDGFDELSGLHESSWPSLLETRRRVLGHHIGTVLAGRPFALKISHWGRVRLSELQQQLRAGRDRDETGLLWSKRHLPIDLAIAITSTGEDRPLAVAFLDMNGLKTINDTHGHAAGDQAIRVFFQAILATLGDHGEAYRGNGGDEVVVILPSATDKEARKYLDTVVRQLGKDPLVLGDAKAMTTLTASCGVATTTRPDELVDALLGRADKAQYRAKAKSKDSTLRVSAIAAGDGDVETHAPGGV
jgi:diguanylate cyclase (GGDEF)-like protein